ncbi:DUF6881 domain-containing protein [Streptomyces sp. NPDC059740]|uniref:DUF6881 domain-containing protein n=1 Tax=Streptomyces sp. NPDC059740 TaxID=3346926 RepID=UPI003666F452
MQYWKVLWHHEFTEEPIAIYSEIGEDGYETRKVERFRDGRWGWASEHASSAPTELGEIPLGSIEDFQNEPEFSAFVITEEEFEAVWRDTVK